MDLDDQVAKWWPIGRRSASPVCLPTPDAGLCPERQHRQQLTSESSVMQIVRLCPPSTLIRAGSLIRLLAGRHARRGCLLDRAPCAQLQHIRPSLILQATENLFRRRETGRKLITSLPAACLLVTHEAHLIRAASQAMRHEPGRLSKETPPLAGAASFWLDCRQSV